MSCETFKEEVDLIVVNASVYTVDENFSKSESFAVKELPNIKADLTFVDGVVR